MAAASFQDRNHHHSRRVSKFRKVSKAATLYDSLMIMATGSEKMRLLVLLGLAVLAVSGVGCDHRQSL